MAPKLEPWRLSSAPTNVGVGTGHEACGLWRFDSFHPGHCGHAFMGALLACVLTNANLSSSLYLKIEVAEMHQLLQEVSCDEPAHRVRTLAADRALVHLTACDIGGLRAFEWRNIDDPKRQIYPAFSEILPGEGMNGTYLQIDFRTPCRGSHCPCDPNFSHLGCLTTWDESFIGDLPSQYQQADDEATVGAYLLESDVTFKLPSEQITLQQSVPNHRNERLCAVQTDSGYVHTNYQPFCSENVTVRFSIGVSAKASVLAAFTSSGRLEPWTSRTIRNIESVVQVMRGTFTAQEMIENYASLHLDPYRLVVFDNFAGIVCSLGGAHFFSLFLSYYDGDDPARTLARKKVQIIPLAAAMLSSCWLMTWLCFWYTLVACGFMVLLIIGIVMIFNGWNPWAIKGEPLLNDQVQSLCCWQKAARSLVMQAFVLGSAVGGGIAFPWMMITFLMYPIVS